jgi:formate dehydrogenase iron-sulfur subunit
MATIKKKGMLIDTSKCIGCKACQIACQQWHQLPAEDTSFTGSYQNPPDMSSANLTVVKFVDTEVDGNPRFLFMADRCRHCADPNCLEACPLGAIKKNAKGMVYITAACDPNECSSSAEKPCQLACPFKNMAETPPLGIPRYKLNNGGTLADGRSNKCDFCYDRWGNATLKGGLPEYLGDFAKSNRPACQVACPTGAITTWKRGAARNKAIARVAYLQENGYPNANVYPVGLTTGVVWVLLEAPSEYGQVDA